MPDCNSSLQHGAGVQCNVSKCILVFRFIVDFRLRERDESLSGTTLLQLIGVEADFVAEFYAFSAATKLLLIWQSCLLGVSTMRRHALSWVSLFCLVLAIIPATAQNTLYENGPINGEVLGWTINLGFFVSDSFTLANPNTTVSGFSFGAWLLPGDVLESAEVSITQYPLSGNTYFDGIVNFTASGCFENFQGFNVCAETGVFNGPTLNAGTYWLNLQNAVSADGNPVYWDMNSGVGCHSIGCPSEAVVSSVGSIPSESFTILGSQSKGTSPEPISLVLFATGALGVFGWIRRT